MNKNLKKKLKTLRRIKPDEEWKTDLRSELLKEDSVNSELAFGSIFLTSAVATFGLFLVFNLQILNSNLTLEPLAVERSLIQEEENIFDYLMDVDIEKLSEREQFDLARKASRELAEEVAKTEEKITRILAENR